MLRPTAAAPAGSCKAGLQHRSHACPSQLFPAVSSRSFAFAVSQAVWASIALGWARVCGPLLLLLQRCHLDVYYSTMLPGQACPMHLSRVVFTVGFKGGTELPVVCSELQSVRGSFLRIPVTQSPGLREGASK